LLSIGLWDVDAHIVSAISFRRNQFSHKSLIAGFSRQTQLFGIVNHKRAFAVLGIKNETAVWEVIGKGRDPVPYEQDYFPEADFRTITDCFAVQIVNLRNSRRRQQQS
jgi:hypothetical protein